MPFTSGKLRSTCRQAILVIAVGLLVINGLPAAVHADHVLPLRLAAKPFSPMMCKGKGERASTHIQVARHRDLVLKRVPGQYVPRNSEDARHKDYVHYLSMADLTNGRIANGAIAFDSRHGIIFQDSAPKGLSRPDFIKQQPREQQRLAQLALNTFLHIHRILNAAVDACRPYPTKIAYETDDKILRIEAGKLLYQRLVRQHNNHLSPQEFVIRHETGYVGGYVNPEAGVHSNVSYHAMNPLNFYVPTAYP